MFCLFFVFYFSFFFFKQKTAYEMRISDWSSDVCSSDLGGHNPSAARQIAGFARHALAGDAPLHLIFASLANKDPVGMLEPFRGSVAAIHAVPIRSEERRVGKECVSTGRSRGSPDH